MPASTFANYTVFVTTVLDTNGAQLKNQDVAWKSSNTMEAIISPDGVLYIPAVATGTATITASAKQTGKAKLSFKISA